MQVTLYPSSPDKEGRLHPLEWRSQTVWNSLDPVWNERQMVTDGGGTPNLQEL